jgi:hypothetical protein
MLAGENKNEEDTVKKKMLSLVLFIVIAGMMLTACKPSTSQINKSAWIRKADMQDVVDGEYGMVYVRDSRTKLCFGVIRSGVSALGGSSYVYSVTLVPCDKVQNQLSE